MEPAIVLVDAEPTIMTTSIEEEIVMSTEVIYQNSDDVVPIIYMELYMKNKVKNGVPCQVRGTFDGYITDDSKDKKIGNLIIQG